MPDDVSMQCEAIDRRSFVKASLISAALPIAAALANPRRTGAEPKPRGPEIIDTNVHLFEWPFRKLKYARTEALIAKLRKHRITRPGPAASRRCCTSSSTWSIAAWPKSAARTAMAC